MPPKGGIFVYVGNKSYFWKRHGKSGRGTEGRMPFAEISSDRAFFRLPALNVLGISPFHAEVVELVDTLGSGSSEGSFMGVRVSPSAP